MDQPSAAARILATPPKITGVLAATLLAAHDLGEDFARLRTAQRLEPSSQGRVDRIRDASRLLGPLLVSAHLRAAARRDALQIAGHPTPPWFVPLVAVAALCAAGRLAFLALPNIALSYLIAFLGGMLYGAIIGALGAALGMVLTDFLLTGLYPLGFVNAPAMALLALVGAGCRRLDFTSAAGRAVAAGLGIVATMMFSVAADTLTWALIYAGRPGLLLPLLLAGLAFNVVPALVNGALFAWGVAPARGAIEAWRRSRPPA